MINPPISIYVNKTAFVPLPLLILGSCLKKINNDRLNFSYEIIDLDFMLKQGFFSDDESFYVESSKLIINKKPDIILFTVHGINHVVVLQLSEIIKKKLPSCTIIVGGVGPTLKAGEAIKRCRQIDVIVKGEGETVLKYLIPAILDNKCLEDVPSIAYHQNNHSFENSRFYQEKDKPIPFPDYSLVNINEYMDHNKKNPYIHPGFVLVETGRGCPYACSFCAPAKMWEGKVRYRSMPDIFEEMKFLAKNGGDFSFFTQDNLEGSFLKILSEFLIEKNNNIKWGCYTRLDRLSSDLAPLMSKAGCRLIFAGLETPNRNNQKAIRKVIDTSAFFTKLQHFNDYQIKFIGSFIVGFPKETDEEIEKTMLFAIECSTSMDFDELNLFISLNDQDKLPQKSQNICLIHPLAYMPGTESFEREIKSLYISRYSLHPDCYGSYMFSHDKYKNDWSFLGCNPYLNYLPEEKVRYYCSILRLFNFLNSRPYYFALLLRITKETPLRLIKTIVADLKEEFVLTSKIKDFETEARNYVSRYLDYTPEWTVKKGQ